MTCTSLGQVDVDETDIAGWWAQPEVRPRAATAGLLEQSGEPVGYAQTCDSDPPDATTPRRGSWTSTIGAGSSS